MRSPAARGAHRWKNPEKAAAAGHALSAAAVFCCRTAMVKEKASWPPPEMEMTGRSTFLAAVTLRAARGNCCLKPRVARVLITSQKLQSAVGPRLGCALPAAARGGTDDTPEKNCLEEQIRSDGGDQKL
ncbi:hypothetical protein GUJ93_ZPchr0006g45539 [Zizania palustris]|uniref:Uncharacterized protein n=1 Tax=Zizania palustris TaxID=103762 RepID=A0A8J5VXI7_ZIZPA|nr:hypothetical protein GUJ93_ZPchr0006g45539 [Zizania palustris]